MTSLSINFTPKRDSDNTYPPQIEAKIHDTSVTLVLDNGREIEITRQQLGSMCRLVDMNRTGLSDEHLGS